VASGGGAFIQPEIKAMIKQKAVSIWLKADLETLVHRTSRTSHRPLLQVANPAERLQQLMDIRYPIYAEADITVVTDRQTPQDMARQIKAELDRVKQGKETDS
jgi:shikimate kinase